VKHPVKTIFSWRLATMRIIRHSRRDRLCVEAKNYRKVQYDAREIPKWQRNDRERERERERMKEREERDLATEASSRKFLTLKTKSELSCPIRLQSNLICEK